MAPHQNSSKLKDKFGASDKCQKSVKDSTIDEMKLNKDFTDKICDIWDLNNLASHSSEVSYLPQNITQLSSGLTELEIANNDFTKLPQHLNLLSNLEKLLIHNNMIKTIPNAIGELQNLRILNLCHNQIKELPDNLSNLKSLEVLDLSHNELQDLPPSYGKLQRLKELNISGNKFKCIPRCVENGMGTLRILSISQNQGCRVNIMPFSKYLEKFYASENKSCCKFPAWLLSSKFFNLQEFDLNKTLFTVYSFVGLKGKLKIKKFSMTCSNLSSPLLEMMIENMVSLESVDVGNEDKEPSGNVFNSIPCTAIQNPAFVREISLRGTDIPSVPVEISKLCNLKKLDLGLNMILWFPDELCELKALESLKIDGNGLIMLPENIGNLESLEEFRAENNNLRRLPESFENLKNLKLLDLFNNIFEELPNMISKMNNLRGIDLEQNYFTTSKTKIRDTSYSILRDNYMSVIPNDQSYFRIPGAKAQKSTESGSTISDDSPHCHSGFSSDEGGGKNNECEEVSEEENWDCETDPDDEFDPNSPKETSYTIYPKSYIPLAPDGFCPADLHSDRVRSEVATMKAYGSVPTFKIQQGQFDDA